MTRVRVDLPAPDFSLQDFTGKTFRLSDQKGKKNILLILNRGFACPYCRRHMSQLREEYEEFVTRDTLVVTVGPEKDKKFASFWEKYDLPFIGLPNPGNTVLRLYGQEVNLFKLGRMPAQMLIDKDGILRYVHYGLSMKDIPSNDEVFGLLDQMQKKVG